MCRRNQHYLTKTTVNPTPLYPSSRAVVDLAVLDEIHWLIGQLQLANADLEAALDWFTTSEDDEGRRFEFAREVEVDLALLEGNLTCLIADSELLNLEEATDFFSRASQTLHDLAEVAEAEFAAVRFAIMLQQLGNRYEVVGEQVGSMSDTSRPLNN